MRNVLILLSFVATCYAGVGVLTPEIEALALKLWQEHCNGASEGGTDGNTLIYCKKSTDKIEETQQHELELGAKEDAKEQVVFVQPPSYHYKHDVVVSGGGAAAPKTIIYVKPAKNTHEVNVNDQTEKGVAPQKPTLYFLKGPHGEEAAAAPAAAARKRRGNVSSSGSVPELEGSSSNVKQSVSDVSIIPDEEIVAPKKRTVYILRTIRAN